MTASRRGEGVELGEDSPVIYPLVIDSGNQRVLREWIKSHDSYILADEGVPIMDTDSDLCVVDIEGLQQYEEHLREIKSHASPTVFPVLLLVPDNQQELVDPPQYNDDEMFGFIDEIVVTPIRKSELNWRIQTLVRLSQQSTELANYTKTLERQRDDLEVLNQVVRHDIRNHLQLVTAFTDTLEEHIDEEGESHREQIRESAENAIELTGTARDLAEVMLQSTTEETASVSLDSILYEQIKAVQSGYSDATIRIDGSIPSLTVVGDEQLGSVFRNLITNAFQHNRSPEPKVTVVVEQKNDGVTVKIADNGPGVPDAQKEDIFGRGKKGLDSDGTGVGLYLVRSLVDRYGGNVWVEDNDPEGAIFIVKLQLATASTK